MSSNVPNQGPQPPVEPEHEEKSKFEKFMENATSNIRDVVAYALLVIGIILLFFQPIYGGLLIGLVFGVYFSKDVMDNLQHIDERVERQGVVRSLIFAGTILALFICAPAIFIAAGIVIALRYFIFEESKGTTK